MFKKPWFWIVLVLVIAVGGGGYVLAQKKAALMKTQTAAAMKQSAASPYATIANGKADVEGGIINVAARRAGVVKAVYVEEGQKVRKNQVLAQQEDDDARLALNSAMAQVGQAKSQVALIEVQKSTAERELARLQPLLSKNYVAHQQIDNARDAVRQADANLGAQRAAIATAEAAVAAARYNVDLSVIRAPADGLIVRRYANPGAGASTLNVSNMFDLEPDTGRIVRAEIVESALPLVAVGQEVELVPEADATKLYPGKVIRISAQFGARKLQSDDPNERTDERVVEVVVSADTAPFLIGQRVLVKFLKPGHHAGEHPTITAATKPAVKAH
ncbi:MAG TPA: HlyD family efflux transporter periplasmic adaptor subunit [Caulobacteraceae bacterium]|jgi:HlyD family secretion protein|nr:HlyD family efflux transporter periplasmic adaptor subunit [Caulobacteraceae bacterium]